VLPVPLASAVDELVSAVELVSAAEAICCTELEAAPLSVAVAEEVEPTYAPRSWRPAAGGEEGCGIAAQGAVGREGVVSMGAAKQGR